MKLLSGLLLGFSAFVFGISFSGEAAQAGPDYYNLRGKYTNYHQCRGGGNSPKQCSEFFGASRRQSSSGYYGNDSHQPRYRDSGPSSNDFGEIFKYYWKREFSNYNSQHLSARQRYQLFQRKYEIRTYDPNRYYESDCEYFGDYVLIPRR